MTSQVLGQILGHALSVLAEPAPTQPPAPDGGVGINVDGIKGVFTKVIIPVLLGGIGLWIIGRSTKGEVSKTMTTTFLAILGVVMVVGSGAFLVIASGLAGTIFGGN